MSLVGRKELEGFHVACRAQAQTNVSPTYLQYQVDLGVDDYGMKELRNPA
jgi:hypothetical protein